MTTQQVKQQWPMGTQVRVIDGQYTDAVGEVCGFEEISPRDNSFVKIDFTKYEGPKVGALREGRKFLFIDVGNMEKIT